MHCPSLMITVMCIRRLCTIPAEVKELDLTTYMYVLYQESHSERLQLPASRCFLDIQDTSYRESFLDFAGPDGFTILSTSVFLLADQYLTRISHTSSM